MSSSERSFVTDFLVGLTAASAVQTVFAPADRAHVIVARKAGEGPPTLWQLFKQDIFSRMIRYDGVASLWRGHLRNVANHAPPAATVFALNCLLGDPSSPLACTLLPTTASGGASDIRVDFWWCFLHHLVAGGTAGLLAYFLFRPIDFAQMALAAQISNARQPHHQQLVAKTIPGAFLEIIQKRGFFTFYFETHVLAVVQFILYGVWLGVFYQLQAVFEERSKRLKGGVVGTTNKNENGKSNVKVFNNVFSSFGAAVLSRAAAIYAGYPIEKVGRYTFLKLNSRDTGAEHVPHYYGRFFATARECYALNGAGYFYRGIVFNSLQPRVLRSALILTAFDQMRRWVYS